MGDIKTRLRTKLFRRASSVIVEESTTSSPTSPSARKAPQPQPSSPSTSATTRADQQREPPQTPLSARGPKTSSSTSSLREKALRQRPGDKIGHLTSQHDLREIHPHHPESLNDGEQTLENSIISIPETLPGDPPELRLQEPTPGSPPPGHQSLLQTRIPEEQETQRALPPDSTSEYSERKQSLVSGADVGVISELLHGDHLSSSNPHQNPPPRLTSTTASSTIALNASMLHRKVWVKRPGAAATIVLIREDDLVDDAKDAILRKYANSIGRHYDAPDVTIRITTRGQAGERILSPDEQMCRTLDSHYPGGQSIEEALILDIPQKRTPRPSPRGMRDFYYQQEDSRPHESGNDYFPPMPPVPLGQPSPLLTNTSHDSRSHDSRQSHAAHERAMSVLNTGQVPALPSPGGRTRTHLSKHNRPNHPRQHTSSPTTLTSSVASRANRPRLDSTASAEKHPTIAMPTALQALPTPPLPTEDRAASSVVAKGTSGPPTPRVASPRPGAKRSKTKQKQPPPETGVTLPPALAALLDTSVPPINVLIVEDNMINMRLLEQFVRRLGVRWQTAVNGQEAVKKWRQGGFHLVLMDIQLPIMSGLEATKEIRRLERVNNIGVFSSASNSAPNVEEGPLGERLKEEDGLGGSAGRLFKSPVIIVALTASNLQSDRHEALAAGCNDFLTKPVNFVWFERKVKEWGCMQALIDFDGWRKWKDFAAANGLKDPKSKAFGKKPVKPTTNLDSTAVSTSTTQNKDFALPVKKEKESLLKEKIPEETEGGWKENAVKGLPSSRIDGSKKEDSPDTVLRVDPGS